VSAAAVAVAVTGVAVTSSTADAQTGRRICSYTQKGSSHLNSLGHDVWVWVAVNYKKDGACPHVRNNAFSSFTDGALNSQPVPKFRCEDWPGHIGGSPFAKGVDVCTQMGVDAVHYFYQDKVTGKYSVAVTANISKFQ
jgi:hypothetical protein